jgi:ComF family protein
MLCSGCRDDLPWMENGSCKQCALPLTSGQLCGQCLQTSPDFDLTLAIFNYDDPVAWMIKRLKFHGDLIYGRLLGNLMADVLPRKENFCRPDVVIPVPLHKKRLKDRGYNQSFELAKVIGERLEIPLNTKGSVRRVATVEQSGLTSKQRRKNVVNAFEIKEDFSGQHVVLLDDVMTTGTTVNELAKQLKRAGAAGVNVWVCARS